MLQNDIKGKATVPSYPWTSHKRVGRQ